MKKNPKYEEAFSIRHEVIGTARQCLYWGFMFLLQCERQENQGCRKVRLSFTALPFSAPTCHRAWHKGKTLLLGFRGCPYWICSIKSYWMFYMISHPIDTFHFLMHWPVLWKLMSQEHSDSSKGVLIQDCCYPRATFLIFRTLLQNHPESSLIRQIPNLLLKQNIQVTFMFDKC